MDAILPHIPRPVPVIIDTDPAGGVFLRDIDDVLAILFLMASPEVRVDALTITFGNASLRKTYEVGRRIRALSGRHDMPVLKGASSWKSLGKRTPASDFIIEYFRENRGRAALVALGPLTNVATALLVEPRLAEWIPAAVIMGGSLKPAKQMGPLSGVEFNFAMNSRAAQIVLKSRMEKWIAPMELCTQARFGFRQLKSLREKNPHSAADRLCDFKTWIRFNSMMFGKGGFFPWDPVAAAMLVEPALFDDVQLTPVRMSRRGLLSRSVAGGEDGRAPCRVPAKLNAGPFIDLLIERLSII